MTSHAQSASEVLSGLREFQQVTSKYAFSRLYDKHDPSLRFLVADEVGLGKTLVARGVIAQAVEHLESIGDRRVDIVYICSNAAIARQNLRKLNIAGEDAITQADRFTMLANEIHKLERRRLNLIAVTPGTSLDFGQSAGRFSERALLYAVLRRVWGREAMQGSGQERVFHLGIADDGRARNRLKAKADDAAPSGSVISRFKKQMVRLNEQRRQDGQHTLKVEFNQLARIFARKGSWKQEERNRRNRFIVELRRALATVGIEALQPDLVILDEFQRFRDLLEPSNETWATRLAHELFDYREEASGRATRTLLLSATPYRPYSTASDAEGDTHFEDFVHTARFLLNDDLSADALRSDLRDLRRSLMVVDRDSGASAEVACALVSNRLRRVMCRTERLASTPDRSGMLEQLAPPLSLERSDVDGYVAMARVAQLLKSSEHLGQADVTEFWKSGPYLLNVMEGYALSRAFTEAAEDGSHTAGLRELVEAGRGFLDWDEVTRYGAIDPANSRLRALVSDTIGRDVWKLLWLPPATCYYSGDGIFDQPDTRSFTKRLVFSSWHLVPKVISAMMSYEAERRIFDAAGQRTIRDYDGFSDRPDRRLDFTVSGGRLESMPALLLLVPFVELAKLCDPLVISAAIGDGSMPTRGEVEAEASRLIAERLDECVRDAPTSGPVDQRWYWAAPMLLELAADEEAVFDWWDRAWPSLWTGNADDDRNETAFARHLNEALDFIEEPEQQPLGRVPDDLTRVLASVSLGGPATCALRSLSRVSGVVVGYEDQLLAGAARIAWGFRSLFNGPEVTALIRATTGSEAYWRAVLEYSAAGHLQAVLDEYLHVLKDWRGFLTTAGLEIIEDLADTALSALSLRTVNYAVDIPKAQPAGVRVGRHTMRGRFAIRFGDQVIEGEQRQQRAHQASQAFNSPFWPFVMTTTSIGQEGLDFHLYSHAVVHWNLPSNPVDFEQREGRVHRYKGHAVRKNVAEFHRGAAFEAGTADPWAAMFAAAADAANGHASSDGELTPYWVYHPQGAPASVERHVLVLPLSSDAARLERLLEAVATYRLSLGQPRQEELIRYLSSRVPTDQLAEIVQRLRVDLSPRDVDN